VASLGLRPSTFSDPLITRFGTKGHEQLYDLTPLFDLTLWNKVITALLQELPTGGYFGKQLCQNPQLSM
jgi:hypothetical protein